MKIALLSVVKFHYQIQDTDADGPVLLSTTAEQATEVMIGLGMLLPDFERRLIGLAAGDTFSCSLSSQQAYGDYQAAAVKKLPRSSFPKSYRGQTNWLKEGAELPMQNDRGQHISGVVKTVGEQEVEVDFNHPLAGKTLFFSGQVLSVRPASKQELEHLHAHRADAPKKSTKSQQ